MKTYSSSHYFSRRGVSLLETLVATGIISFLATISLTVRSQMIQSSDLVHCTSNLRALANAGIQFAADHQGRFTSSNWINHTNQLDKSERLRPGLREYMGMEERTTGKDTSFTCPALQRTHRTTGFAFNHNYVLNTYAVNNPSQTKDGENYYPDDQIGYMHVPRPNEMMFFMDGIPGSEDHRGYYFSTTISPKTALNAIFPHKDKINMVFLDGRVSRITPEQLSSYTDSDPFWSGGMK